MDAEYDRLFCRTCGRLGSKCSCVEEADWQGIAVALAEALRNSLGGDLPRLDRECREALAVYDELLEATNRR